MKSPRRSWRARTRSTRAGSACAWRRPGRAASTCSTDSTTRSWTASRCWRSPACTYHDLIGTLAQQDVELDKLFQDVAVFNERVMGPAHVENLADLACRTALELPRRGAHHVPDRSAGAGSAGDERSKRNLPHHTSDVCARSARLPAESDLRRAAEILNAGKKIAILAGQGALRRRRRAGADRGEARRADHQSAAGQSRGAGRQPVHHRRHRAAGHEAVAGRAWRSATRC